MNASVYVCTRARVPGALTWGVEEPARSNPAGVAVELPTLSKGRPSSGFCTPGARNSPMTRGLSVCARALLLPFLAFGLRATPQAAGSFAQQLLDVESALMRGCGTACLDVLHEVTSNFSGGAESRGDVLRRVADHGLVELDRAQQIPERTLNGPGGSLSLRGQTRGAASTVLSSTSPDTPCATPAACALKERAANKCNYGRLALLSAYNEVNVLVHVLSAVISTLCGCVHVQSVSHCMLQQLSPTCAFPYTVYSKAFAGSVQLWEAVKASTNKCGVHAVHPAVR